MSKSLYAIIPAFLTLFCGTAAWAVEPRPASEATPRIALKTGVGDSPAASKFSDEQIAFVNSWIREKAPECPVPSVPVLAEQFLEDLRLNRPDQLDRLLAPDFSLRDHESGMLQRVAGQLTGPSAAPRRVALARRRIQLLLDTGTSAPTVGGATAAGLLAKIQEQSESYHRRLLEGRMDDDGLRLQLRKLRAPDAASEGRAPAKARELNASDILAEFARRNLNGGALPRLRAYTVEGQLRSAAGEEQHLLLFRLRPDWFRLVVQVAGTTRFIMAGTGTRFWQQLPGQTAEWVPQDKLGDRRYLAEFSDLLLESEGCTFDRLPDGTVGDRPCHRLAVKRANGSAYVARIDTETFREIGRENPDQTTARYSDFRNVAGVTMAFREEVTGTDSRTGVFVVSRITPNPGLVEAFFEPPGDRDQTYFTIERLLAQAPTTKATP